MFHCMIMIILYLNPNAEIGLARIWIPSQAIKISLKCLNNFYVSWILWICIQQWIRALLRYNYDTTRIMVVIFNLVHFCVPRRGLKRRDEYVNKQWPVYLNSSTLLGVVTIRAQAHAVTYVDRNNLTFDTHSRKPFRFLHYGCCSFFKLIGKAPCLFYGSY